MNNKGPFVIAGEYRNGAAKELGLRKRQSLKCGGDILQLLINHLIYQRHEMILNEYNNFNSCPDTTHLKTLDLDRKLRKSRMATMLEEYNVIRKSDLWKNIFFEFFGRG